MSTHSKLINAIWHIPALPVQVNTQKINCFVNQIDHEVRVQLYTILASARDPGSYSVIEARVSKRIRYYNDKR